MTSRIRATKMRAARAALLVVALVVAVVAAFGATTALAAVPGDPLKLGQLNTIDALTRLVGTRATALLQVKNDGGPALNLTVPAGQAPLVVSAGAGTAPNLSADKLDGKDASAFLPTKTYSRTVEGQGEANKLVQQSARCDPGDIAISGGYLGVDSKETAVTDSHPAGQSASGLLPTEWSVIWRSPATPDLIGVMVVCINLP